MKLSSPMFKTFSSPPPSGHRKALSMQFSVKPHSLHRKRGSHTLNSSHSSGTSTIASPTLSALRSRHKVRVASPDPSLASMVVTQYLIPMFEADAQHKSDLTRTASFGSPRGCRTLDPVPGTVYGELKLSEQLSKELQALRQELKETQAKLRESEQRKASAMSELMNAQERILELEAHVKNLIASSRMEQRRLQDMDLTESKLRQELKTLQDSYTTLEEAHKAGNSLLQDQYAIIDKLRNRATEQEHINSLLLMENDIIGERLKGLYFAIQRIADVKYLEEQLTAEMLFMSKRVKELVDFTDQIYARLRETIAERDMTAGDNMELVTQRNEMRAERDKMAKIAKEKIADLQATLQKSEEEREKLSSKFEEAEKNFKDLTDEYEKMRQKAKQYRLRRKQYGEEEEKVCRNCQKVFIESENYNWSCRRHQNEYSGEMYWCCGKSNRDAIGCKISKHESKEDEDEEEIAKEAVDQTTMKCPSCRKYGHSVQECPRDPNPRSAHDVFEEITRIHDIYSIKRKADDQVESSQALGLLLEKNSNEMFNVIESESDSLSLYSESHDLEGSDESRGHFHDIKKLKEEVVFDTAQNFVTVEMQDSKDKDSGSKTRRGVDLSLSRQKSRIRPDLTSEAIRYLKEKSEEADKLIIEVHSPANPET